MNEISKSKIKQSKMNNDYTKLYEKGLKHFYGIDCRINYKEAYEIFI